MRRTEREIRARQTRTRMGRVMGIDNDNDGRARGYRPSNEGRATLRTMLVFKLWSFDPGTLHSFPWLSTPFPSESSEHDTCPFLQVSLFQRLWLGHPCTRPKPNAPSNNWAALPFAYPDTVPPVIEDNQGRTQLHFPQPVLTSPTLPYIVFHTGHARSANNGICTSAL